MVRFSAVPAGRARERNLIGARVDDRRLPLGRSADPEVEVVRSVPMKQFANPTIGHRARATARTIPIRAISGVPARRHRSRAVRSRGARGSEFSLPPVHEGTVSQEREGSYKALLVCGDGQGDIER